MGHKKGFTGRTLERRILLEDRVAEQLPADARDRLLAAIPLFEEVVEINPQNWAAMWVLGKV